MAKKSTLATGTAVIIPRTVPRAMIINADKDPNPDNPHTWFPLIGDPSGSEGDRILWGVMRRTYRGHMNSADTVGCGDPQHPMLATVGRLIYGLD